MKRKSTLRKYYVRRPVTREYLKLVSEAQRILKRLEKLGDRIMDLETDSVMLAREQARQTDQVLRGQQSITGNDLPPDEPLFENETEASAELQDRQNGSSELPPPGKCGLPLGLRDNRQFGCDQPEGSARCAGCAEWIEQARLPLQPGEGDQG